MESQNTRCGGLITAIRHIEMTLYEKRETVDACDQTGEPSCQNFVFYCEMKCVKSFIKSCSSLEHGNPSFDKLLKTVMARYFRSPWGRCAGFVLIMFCYDMSVVARTIGDDVGRI